MKFLIVFLFPIFALAEITDVSIISFRPAGDRRLTGMADLCGHVKFKDEKLVIAKIKVDRDAEYYSIVGENGNFCETVLTYYGRAEVSARSIISGEETKPIVVRMK